MFHNGVPTQQADAAPGDTITLQNSAILMVEQRALRWDEVAGFPDFVFGGRDPFGLVGESAAAWWLRAQIVAAANAESHILVHGASGVGKELVAGAIHRASARASGPLVSRNAATLPESLIEAELFGNIKNYPNPGSPERKGLVGEADAGTLLLDEIGELPHNQQAHFLRVLDGAGEYQRLGEGFVRRSSMRVIALTNRALDQLKPDFLARFTQHIRVPALDERLSDIPLLMRHAWQALRREQPNMAQLYEQAGSGQVGWEPLIEPSLVELLVRHRFNLNYRELERLLRVAMANSKNEYIGVSPELKSQLNPKAPQVHIDRETLVAALGATNGSPSAVAERLGLRNRHVVRRLMKKFGIESPP